MENTSIGTIIVKLQYLTPEAIEEVCDFVEFLSNKQNKIKEIKNVKDILLNISVWSEDDIKVFDEIRGDFNKWNIEEF